MRVAERLVPVERAGDALARVCERRGIPGAALGVLAGGEVVARVTWGTANRDTGLPVGDGTLFQAGSIGKSYTATVVMMLAEEGRLNLDAPIRDYLPDLVLSDPDATASVTARQLLTHTSDIDGDSIDEEGKYGRGDDCLARYAADLKDLPMIADPGSIWSYCNSGYILLGRLIEVLTGTTYEDAVSQRLFKPLGLQETFFFPEDMMTHSFAVGHLPQPGQPPAVAPQWALSRAADPAGGISTTIDELLAFGRLHLVGGLASDGTRVLSDGSVRAMQHPEAACPETELAGDHWGLGWFLRTGQGPLVVGHDGNTTGQTAALRLIPEHQVAFAVLINLAGQNWAFAELAQELLDPWLGTQTPGKPVPAGPASDSDDGRFAGLYEKFGARIRITLDQGTLQASIQPAEGRKGGLDPRPRPVQRIDDSRVLLHLEEFNDDLPITFLHRDDSGRPQFLHMGARAYARVAAG